MPKKQPKMKAGLKQLSELSLGQKAPDGTNLDEIFMEVRNKAFADSVILLLCLTTGRAHLKALEIGRILDIEEQQLVISICLYQDLRV